MAQPVDLLVDRAVLLDVGVRTRNVGLGLVVVVVRDEELDAVLRQHVAQLRGELRRQGLVGFEDERRSLHLFDEPRDGRGLATAGDPLERLVPQAVLDTLGECGDGLGLVARRLEGRLDEEVRHARPLSTSAASSWP